MAVARNQHQQNINLRAQNQGQVQPPVNPAVQAQMVRQAQMRMHQRGAQGAALRQQFNQSQKRPTNVQTSSALSGRSGGSSAAPIFAGQQMGNNMGLFNSGFSVAVPPTHERNGSNKTTSMQASTNAANLAYMAMMSNSTSAGALNAQLANANTASPAAIAAGLKGMPALQQQFMQGNMMNYFPGQDTPAGGISAMQNAARMSGRPAVVPGMIPADPIMSTLMPNGQHNNLMRGMQGNKSNTPVMGAPSSVNNTAPSTSEALSEIDKALCLGLP